MTTTEGHRAPLPTTVLPVPNESAPAYLARLTRANSGTKRLRAQIDFFGPTNLEAWHDVGATASTFKLVTHLTGIPVNQLLKTLNARLLPDNVDGRPRLTGSQIPRPLMAIDRLRACSVCTDAVPRLRLQPWTDPTAFTCSTHGTLLTDTAAPVDVDVLIAQHELRRMWDRHSRRLLRLAIEDALTIVNDWTGPAGHLRIAAAWNRREEASDACGRDALLLRMPEVIKVACTLIAHAHKGTRQDNNLHGRFERITCQALNARTTQRWTRADTAP